MRKISRRHFFQGAATALAATRVIGANDRISIGVIGLGGRGRAHLRYWAKIPESQIAALCDVFQEARERAQADLTKLGQPKAKEYVDLRDLYADKEIDAVSIATPNHWHALATIWACEAGKDVYVEKPATHNIYEGWRMIETARRTQRIVQVGHQSRSSEHIIKAMHMLQEGVIGQLYMARGLCFKRRRSIGKTPPEPVPPGLNWDLFLGPAPMRPFTWNRYRYNWHWFWDTGNGDIGNQGVHEMDICRWGLGVSLPKTVVSTGGKYVYDDDQETPNTQLASFQYDGKQIVFEVRGLLTGPEAGLPVRPGNTIGNIFFGSDGWMWVDGGSLQVYKGESLEKVIDERAERGGDTTVAHMQNFLAACRSRNYKDLNCDVEVGVLSAALCHLANISYRVGRLLHWDDAQRKFVNDPEADQLLTRRYREPYVV